MDPASLDEYTARDGFDKEAIKQLKSGKSFYDRIEEREGKRPRAHCTPPKGVH